MLSRAPMADEIAPVEAAPTLVAEAAEAAAPAVVAPAVVAPVAEAPPAPPAEATLPEAAAEQPVASEPVEATPEAVVAEEAPAEPVLPTYADFKVPEGFSLPAERLTEFTGVLGKYGLTQEAGQELLDLHAATFAQFRDAIPQQQRDAFAETRRTWREDFYKSAGNRSGTMANDAKWAINQLVRDTAARTELHTVLDNTGAGDNKAVIGLLARAAKVMRERAAPPPNLPAKGQALTPAEKRYGARPANR